MHLYLPSASIVYMRIKSFCSGHKVPLPLDEVKRGHRHVKCEAHDTAKLVRLSVTQLASPIQWIVAQPS